MAKDRLLGKLAVILYSGVAKSPRSKQQDEQLTHIRNTYHRYILSCCLLTYLTCGFYTTALFASPDYWPTNGWRSSSPEDQGMDSVTLIKMMEKVRLENYAINSITVIRNGYLVTKANLWPFPKYTDLNPPIFSVTKSFTSALVGIALDKGYIKSVRQPLLEFFPEKTITNLNEQKKEITVEHLLTMSSGLDTQDSWVYQWRGLYKMQASKDWAQYVLDLPMARTPGEHFDYSNGGSYLLSAILQKTTQMSPLEFGKIHLFGPLGITDVRWLTSPQGINRGDDLMRLAPLDMAKFGLLYLNLGRWEDKQIVSKAWVEGSTRMHIHVPDNGFDGYGYQWWVPSANSNSPEYYMAAGYLGQFIFVVPQKNLVVVFTSNLRGDDFFIPKKLLDNYIIPAAVSFRPLPAQTEEKERLDSLIADVAKSPSERSISTIDEN